MIKITGLAVLIAFLSLILLRCYDKFYNKQYDKSVYVNNFFISLLASLLVLYVDNHFSNSMFTTSNSASITSPSTTIQKGGMPSSLTDLTSKFKFDTGTPNF